MQRRGLSGSLKPAQLDVLLDPLRSPGTRRYPATSVSELLRRSSTREVLTWLAAEKLQGHWADSVIRERLATDAWETPLRAAVTRAVARGLSVHALVQRATLVLLEHGIPFAVFKGCHLSRDVYERPWHRHCADADVLVAPRNVRAAVDALERIGFRPVPLRRNLTHEMTLVWQGAQLDLHWELMRPARLARPVAEALLDQRSTRGEFAVPSTAYTGFILLVHPAVTEYVTLALSRALDLQRWFLLPDREWDHVVKLVADARLRTAAWAMLEWSQRWFDVRVPADVLSDLAPRAVKRAYLRRWLDADPAHFATDWPNLVRGAFSLPLHDSAWDSVSAIRGYLKNRTRPPLAMPG